MKKFYSAEADIHQKFYYLGFCPGRVIVYVDRARNTNLSLKRICFSCQAISSSLATYLNLIEISKYKRAMPLIYFNMTPTAVLKGNIRKYHMMIAFMQYELYGNYSSFFSYSVFL